MVLSEEVLVVHSTREKERERYGNQGNTIGAAIPYFSDDFSQC